MKNSLVASACALFSLISLVGCFEKNGEFSTAQIPVLHLLCNTAQGCSVSMVGRTAQVGMSSNSITCNTYFAGIGPSEVFSSRFDASNVTTLSFKSSWVEAYVTHWIDGSGRAIAALPLGNYKVCAFIDNNNNGHWDANEMIGEGAIIPGQATAEITDWY